MVRSTPAPRGKHTDYLPALRPDFSYSCAYCTLSEAEAAGVAFEVDHYLPASRYPGLVANYSNLMYSCRNCNELKADLPDSDEAKAGFRFFCADADCWNDHFQVAREPTLALDHVTREVGRYSIETLELNGEFANEVRALRKRLAVADDVILRGLKILQGQKIDSIPTEARHLFIATRARLSSEATTTVSEAMAREVGRSVLLDARASALARRRAATSARRARDRRLARKRSGA